MLQVKGFVFNPFGENTYLVYDATGSCLAVDPGCCSPAEVDELCRFIDERGLRLDGVVNTHGHIDHIAGNTRLAQRYGVKVMAGKGASRDFAKTRLQASLFGFPNTDPVAPPDVELEEGATIPVGDGTLEVIATPGHAKGSISLYAEEEGIVFTGDALFCRSIGRTDLPGGDYAELCRSIKEKLFRLPDDTTVLSGHGEATTIGEERDFNLYVS